jgi:hypothetical protein
MSVGGGHGCSGDRGGVRGGEETGESGRGRCSRRWHGAAERCGRTSSRARAGGAGERERESAAGEEEEMVPGSSGIVVQNLK